MYVFCYKEKEKRLVNMVEMHRIPVGNSHIVMLPSFCELAQSY